VPEDGAPPKSGVLPNAEDGVVEPGVVDGPETCEPPNTGEPGVVDAGGPETGVPPNAGKDEGESVAPPAAGVVEAGAPPEIGAEEEAGGADTDALPATADVVAGGADETGGADTGAGSS
jgi:hypothetical protein